VECRLEVESGRLARQPLGKGVDADAAAATAADLLEILRGR